MFRESASLQISINRTSVFRRIPRSTAEQYHTTCVLLTLCVCLEMRWRLDESNSTLLQRIDIKIGDCEHNVKAVRSHESPSIPVVLPESIASFPVLRICIASSFGRYFTRPARCICRLFALCTTYAIVSGVLSCLSFLLQCIYSFRAVPGLPSKPNHFVPPLSCKTSVILAVSGAVIGCAVTIIPYVIAFHSYTTGCLNRLFHNVTTGQYQAPTSDCSSRDIHFVHRSINSLQLVIQADLFTGKKK
jgi:hypothetical protein